MLTLLSLLLLLLLSNPCRSDLNKGAEECHEGLCDDMILQSTGPF
jgi:hypothetical protein